MTLDAVETVLRVALAHTWVRETQGANHGEAVDAILAKVGLAPGAPWCAALVAYVGNAVLGRLWPLPLVGGCVSLHDAAAQRGLLRDTPAPGAVFLLWSEAKGRWHHTGFCRDRERDAGGTTAGVPTVEGNTSPDGSPEGTGVFVRVRTFGPKDRFIHWWEPVAAVAPVPVTV